MANKIHPHELMGMFCKKYEDNFKKVIETGNYDIETKTEIQNFKFNATPALLSQGNTDAGQLFLTTLTYLGFLMKNPNDERRKRLIGMNVSKLNRILQGDEIFDKARK